MCYDIDYVYVFVYQFRLFYYVLLNKLKFISCIFTLDWIWPVFQKSSSSFLLYLPFCDDTCAREFLRIARLRPSKSYTRTSYNHMKVEMWQSLDVVYVCAFFSFLFFFVLCLPTSLPVSPSLYIYIYIISLWQCIVRAWYGSVPRFKIITNDATSLLYSIRYIICIIFTRTNRYRERNNNINPTIINWRWAYENSNRYNIWWDEKRDTKWLCTTPRNWDTRSRLPESVWREIEPIDWNCVQYKQFAT